MTRPYCILNVANKRLPDHDYRIQYRQQSRVATVVFGLPGKPASLDSEEYLEMGFSEGLSWADLKHFFLLARYFRSSGTRYDCVHFFSTKLQLFGPICAALFGVPCVCTVTGFGRTFNREEVRYRLLRPIYLWVLWVSIRLSKAVFFQNHGDMQWLTKKLPGLAAKMHWIGSGVQAEITHKKDFSQRPLSVLMVARLMPDKGIRDYLEAARQLQGDQYRFLLVGPPSVGQEKLQREVKLAEQQGAIEYLGELDQHELGQHYKRSHVFAFPSHGEGMPRVMLEAGHALMCPIASDIPAHRELVKEGRGFLMAQEDRAESLVAHLRTLQSDRTLLEQYARKYQQLIVENYSVEAYTRRVDEYMLRLLPAEKSLARPDHRAA